MDSAEETTIKLNYKHAFSTDDLRNIRKPFNSNAFNSKPTEESIPEIKSCVTHKPSKLTVIGQTDGKIIYWRPRRWNHDDDQNSKNDQDMNDKLVCYKFDGHLNASIHSLCYGMLNLIDRKHNKYGLLLSGSADSKIKVWDPWHREEKSKQFPILELNGHTGTVLCIKYENNQLISGSTDNTIRIWMCYTPDNNQKYHQQKEIHFKNAKLKKVASTRQQHWKNISHSKRLRIAQTEPVSHAFNQHFANAQYFNDPQKKKNEYLMNLNNKEINDDNPYNSYKKKSKKRTDIDELIYPEIQCQQIIKFDAWCRCICPSINNKCLIYIADDNGILYSFNTSWTASKTIVSTNTSSSKSLKSSSSQSNGSDLDGSMLGKNKTFGIRSKVKTIYVNDRKTSPVYNMEYYSKFHRLPITFMLFVSKANYIITLSSDYTLQVHDALSCGAIFGVKNPENCKYTSADYNYDLHELYVVGIFIFYYLYFNFSENISYI